ncbi:MAG: LamG domain-containing protein, partial [Patescibacteria group bacterium]
PIDYGDPSLVGYWTFNEGSGTKAYDYSGHNASGTLACAGSGCTNPSWVSGRVGSNALSINPLLSSSSYVAVPIINNPSVSGNALSISIWINPSVSQSKGGWLLRNGGGIDENYGFYLGSPSGGNYKMNIEGYSGGFRNAGTTSYIIPTSVWSHIVLVFTQGLSFQVYLNGALQQTVNFPYVTAISTSAFYIGGNANSAVQNLDGSMDDVRIYNRALSASEILALYNATK